MQNSLVLVSYFFFLHKFFRNVGLPNKESHSLDLKRKRYNNNRTKMKKPKKEEVASTLGAVPISAE